MQVHEYECLSIWFSIILCSDELSFLSYRPWQAYVDTRACVAGVIVSKKGKKRLESGRSNSTAFFVQAGYSSSFFNVDLFLFSWFNRILKPYSFWRVQLLCTSMCVCIYILNVFMNCVRLHVDGQHWKRRNSSVSSILNCEPFPLLTKTCWSKQMLSQI